MDQPKQGLPVSILVATGAALLFSAYWSIFALTTDDGLIGSAFTAAYNALPALALAFIAHALLDRFVWPKSSWVQLGVQIPAAVLFALVWYILILVMHSLRDGSIDGDLILSSFVPIAFAWQMFQGVTFYALVAMTSLAIALGRRLKKVSDQMAEQTPIEREASSILVKTQDETHNIAITDIVAVSGAGDYSELILSDRTLLSTSRLGEFEARLPESLFLRAHRSHLVRLDAVTRSEPAGNGRTTLHLENGMSVTTSRSGSRLLKEAAM